MTNEELKILLENHRHWIMNDCEGWQNMRANLRYVDLCGADLRDANLRYVDLRGANLRYVDLRGADLRYVDLRGADLRYVNLRGANLRGADLRDADLRDADLRGADLRDADLCGADLCGADLRGADLCGADLCGADLRDANLRYVDLCGADLRYVDLRGTNLRDADLRDADLRGADLRDADLRGAKNVPFIPYACPDFGMFIGFKKANGYIVVLEIPEDAKRLSSTGRKCRCDKAKVLSIQNIDGTEADVTEVESDYDKGFIYKVGEIVKVDDFNDNRWEECSSGIHFFINRQEAVEY